MKSHPVRGRRRTVVRRTAESRSVEGDERSHLSDHRGPVSPTFKRRPSSRLENHDRLAWGSLIEPDLENARGRAQHVYHSRRAPRRLCLGGVADQQPRPVHDNQGSSDRLSHHRPHPNECLQHSTGCACADL